MYNNNKTLAEGWHIGSQTPMDDRRYYDSIATLDALIVAGTLPYKLFEGIVVWTKDTNRMYRWVESAVGITTAFTYPAGIIAAGVSYGGRTFKFVELTTTSTTNLYSVDDTVATTRTAIITDTLVWRYFATAKPFITWDVATDKITWHATTVNIDKLGNTTTDKVLGIKDNGDVIHHVAHRITLDFDAVVQYSYRAPDNFRVLHYDNPDSLTVTLKVNGVAYVLGDTITKFTDTLTIDVSAVGLINLNCEYIF